MKSLKERLEEIFGDKANFVDTSRRQDYREIEDQFNIRRAGFGRGINSTDESVILISSAESKRKNYVYHDGWTDDGMFIYSGEGKSGDQELIRGNRAVLEAEQKGKTITLFIKLSSDEYYCQGQFELVDYDIEDDEAEDGTIRQEIKFKLKKLQLKS